MILGTGIEKDALPGKATTAFHWATALLAFSIPMLSQGVMIPILIWVAAWVFVPKQSLAVNWKPILVFTGIYVFHLVGMLYTDNVPRGLNDLEQKASLLIFPLLFGSVRKDVAAEVRKPALLAFVVGCATSVAVSILESYLKYRNSGDLADFYMSEFSHAHHPSYIAMYVNLAIVLLLMALFRSGLSSFEKLLAWLLTFALAISLILPASKMGFIQFGFLLIFMLFFAWKEQKLVSRSTAIMLGIGAVFFIALQFDPVASSRVSATIEVLAEDEGAGAQPQIESNAARLSAWRVAVTEIMEHPFGVGTGDINDVMVASFEREGLDELAEKGLNPHNNFLQIALALGIPALLWFVISLIYPFRQIVRTQDWIYAFFLLSIGLHFMVESMLEKQSGVVFFAFFNALCFFSMPKKSKL